MKRRPHSRLPRINQIADRNQSYERVERKNDRLYLVDTRGLLADVEVLDEETEGWHEFQEYVARMTRTEQINRARLAIRHEPWMTFEAKQVRDDLLRARWRELFGDAMFVVDDPPEWLG